MKFPKTLPIVAMGTVILSMNGTIGYAANVKDQVGEGQVNFVEDTSPEGIVNPEDPDSLVVVDPKEGSTNQTTGSLLIDFVSHLKFGTHTAETSEGIYKASPTIIKDKQTNAEVSVGNYIQVTDKRSNGYPKGWTLSAQVTKPFTNAADRVLKGASITYNLPFVNSKSASELADYPVSNGKITLDTTSDTGLPSSGKFMSAESGKGWGQYTLEFGRPELNGGSAIGGTDATSGEAVTLKVPADTQLNEDTSYTAEITWTIADLPVTP